MDLCGSGRLLTGSRVGSAMRWIARGRIALRSLADKCPSGIAAAPRSSVPAVSSCRLMSNSGEGASTCVWRQYSSLVFTTKNRAERIGGLWRKMPRIVC